MRARALAVLAALVMAAPAFAQSAGQGGKEVPPDVARLKTYVTSPDYFKNVETVILGGDHDIAPDCKTTKVIGRIGLGILGMPRFKDGSDTPVAGAWKDSFQVDRCGMRVRHNVLVSVEADGPHVGLLLPGENDLPVRLQIQAFRAGAERAMKSTACGDPSQVMVVDTRHDKVLAPVKVDEKGLLKAGKWRELWTFRACGKTLPMAMVFTADGKGSATFAAAPAK